MFDRVKGADPAPPPTTKAFAANSAELASVDTPLAYRTPPDVNGVAPDNPVPPLAVANVPATDTAPLVAVLGVSPVDPNEIVVTPDAAAAPHAGTPLEIVRTCPDVPIGSFESVLEADAYRISPVVYVDWFVPPLVGPSVPARVIAPVDDVLGVNPDKLVWNDVTPPVDGCQDAVVPLVVRT